MKEEQQHEREQSELDFRLNELLTEYNNNINSIQKTFFDMQFVIDITKIISDISRIAIEKKVREASLKSRLEYIADFEEISQTMHVIQNSQCEFVALKKDEYYQKIHESGHCHKMNLQN